MKTAIFPENRPKTGFLRAVLRGAMVIAALASTSSQLMATTVSWVSGGPETGYPSGAGFLNGPLNVALYHTPCGLAIDSSGTQLLVADRNNNTIRLLDLSGGFAYTLLTLSNNIPVKNLFSRPIGVALDDNDNIFVLNQGTGKNGTVIEFNYMGELIATNMAHITNAAGLALDPSDNLYVTASNRVFEISSSNTVRLVTTITAKKAALQGIVVRHNGQLAVCDYGRDGILGIDPVSGNVSTNAGFHGKGDFIDANNYAYSNMATFYEPSGIAESGDGTLIVTDYGNNRVKAVLANGNVTNVYGVSSKDWLGPFRGFSDGTVTLPDQPGGVAAREPKGVVVAPDGSLYTSEDYYHIIQHVTDAGFQPPPPPPPVPPTGLTATLITNIDGNVEVYLTWDTSDPAEGVTNYTLERTQSPNGVGPYEIIDNTSGTSFTDATVGTGITYYYILVAENEGGSSLASAPVSVTTPTPPPGPPTIGSFDYEQTETNGTTVYLSTFHPLTNSVYIVQNDLSYAVVPNVDGVNTYFASGLTQSNASYSWSGFVTYTNGQTATQTPLPITPVTNLTIQAENVNPFNETSSIVSVQIIYQCAPPAVVGTDAAQFLLSDPSANITYYYTTDGTDPLTNTPPSQEIPGNPTNSLTQISLNISSNFTFSVRAMRDNYLPSQLYTYQFQAANFQNNELTWGFASGEASSKFIGSPGETFYAPVTLTTLPGTAIYSMQFNMVETNLGADPVASGAYNFESMLEEPLADGDFEQIPPLMFVGDDQNPPPSLVYFNGTNFVNEEVIDTNLNELAVGWYELLGQTNLYNTKSQTLITYSQAFIDLFPNQQQPQGVIVGGYGIQIPTNAVPGEQYQIQLNRPSADSDGLGAANSAVSISLPTTGSLGAGAINSIKDITVGQPKYLAGDVYPFEWFNAGDFGNGDLITYGADDVQNVFDAAIYGVNVPPPGSDFFDAMDSSGGYGNYDADAGYWTNANITANTAARNALFNVNDDTTINKMAFGDGVLDVCDVYVTFLRSEVNGLYWFERFYTNDTTHGVFGRVAQAITVQTNVLGALVKTAVVPSPNVTAKGVPAAYSQPAGLQVNTPVSITNTPTVHFAAGDYMASPGRSISIPITANVFGLNPLRMLMFNIAVVPLDGSPALTIPVTFTPNAPFNNSSIYNPAASLGVETNSTGNCAAAFLPVQPLANTAGIIGSNVIGYLNVVVPSNARGNSAYAISFSHASASPNGLVSFPKTTYTGLITLSSRTNSTYGDGIPDSWRLRYFGTVYNQLSVSNADADGTGMNNWQKYLAGLNPVDPTSVLNEGLDQPMAQSQQDAVIYWPSVSGQTYVIKRSSSLFPPQWTSISTNMGTGTYMEIHDTNGGNSRFYEVTTP